MLLSTLIESKLQDVPFTSMQRILLQIKEAFAQQNQTPQCLLSAQQTKLGNGSRPGLGAFCSRRVSHNKKLQHVTTLSGRRPLYIRARVESFVPVFIHGSESVVKQDQIQFLVIYQ
jgi:hypothetical protein